MKKFNFAYFSLMFSNKMIIVLSIFLLGMLTFSCSSTLYTPTTAEVTANASLKDLSDGRAAYINKCGGCHNLFVPEKYSAGEWKGWVNKMESKANITSSEKEQILKYLTKGK